MLDLDFLSVNDDGHLVIDGVDALELMSEFGTPLYVMTEKVIRENCKLYKSAIEECYGEKGMTLYAGKAMMCKEICRIMKSEGIGLDVVSAGELYTAIKSGFPAENIHFHGNNKTLEEIKLALENGVGRIVVDNFDELEVINSFSRGKGISTKILLRIKPSVDVNTCEAVKTGNKDSKFGFAIESGEALDAVSRAVSFKNVELKGLHCHIGSQIWSVEPFKVAANIMLKFMKSIKQRFKIEMQELNLGGGYAVRYVESDKKVDYRDYIKQVSDVIKDKVSEYNLSMPHIYLEPGREIVAQSGVTLYQVGSVKEIQNVRIYASVDGGMTDNPRYALYNSDYTVLNASKMNKLADSEITIVGKCCESGDIIQKNVKLKMPEVGDIIAVLCTGAYNYSMASNYNRIQRAPVVMIKNGQKNLIVKKQSLDDVIAQDI